MNNPIGTLYGSQYSLGNYDQCLNTPSMPADPKIITQYCLADVTLTDKNYKGNERSVLGSMEPYVAIKTNIGRNLNKVTWGTCLPSVCKHSSISKIMKTIYMANPLTPAEPEITVESCQIAGLKTEFSSGFYAFIILMTTLVVVSVLSTGYLQIFNQKSGDMNRIAESFSIKRNWTSLTKKSGEEIGIFNVMKVCLATFVVCTHTIIFEVAGPISNGMKWDELLSEVENPLKSAIKHIDLPAVDNFLMISGLLLIKGLMDKKKKPLVALVNRYFRLAGSFAVVIFYIASVSIHTGDGPLWQRFAGSEQKACTDTWWLGLLMLNNYFNCENMCLLPTWYIPCDYQLAIMGTILYLVWQKDKTLGKLVTTITVIVAVLLPGIVTYWRRLPGMLLYPDVEQSFNFRKNIVFLDTYSRSHNRAGPYLMGMAMGYIMSVYKPDKHRNVISKGRSFLLLAVAYIVSITVLTSPLSWTTLEYDHLNSAVYAASSRSLWALASCIMIGIVEYGDVATVRKVTNWHGFTILSRLTYGIYITHSVLLHKYIYSIRNPQELDDSFYSEVILSFGVLMVSGVVATFLWLFVEAPLNNIVNLFINSGSKGESKIKSIEDEKGNKGF